MPVPPHSDKPPAKRKIGRPTLCTPETMKEIEECLGLGMSLKSSALVAGVTVQTICEWRQKGELGIEPYAEFSERFARARAKGAKVYQQVVFVAATAGDVRAAQWTLSKMEPAHYGDKLQAEVSGPGGGPIQMQAWWEGLEGAADDDDVDPPGSE